MAKGFSDDNSDLIVMAQRSLDAEFPPDAQARRVLSAIGGQDVGHSTFSSVVGRLPEGANAAGTALTRALKVLATQKNVVAVETPAGQSAAARLRRYRITDPYLRFWFRFVEPNMAQRRRHRSYTYVNAWWNRDHSVEVDIVSTSGHTIAAIGSIKWRPGSRARRAGARIAAKLVR